MAQPLRVSCLESLSFRVLCRMRRGRRRGGSLLGSCSVRQCFGDDVGNAARHLQFRQQSRTNLDSSAV